jgi:DNA-binding MarR family transcriptional regulator
VAPRDHVDWALEHWNRERPDVDTAAKAVTQRIGRVARHIERATDQVFEPFGLDPHEFYVLGVLRRAGAPFRLTPTRLARTLLLTPGSVTYRINRLEQAGLVTRIPDPADRRGVLVELTPRGLDLADRAIEALARAEARVVDPLNADERRELERLLRKLLLSFGDEPPR